MKRYPSDMGAWIACAVPMALALWGIIVAIIIAAVS